MRGKLFTIVCVLVLTPLLVLGGTTGKIRGKISDKETGEALVGASVIVKGTSLGASADINGEFVILNVPPGMYSLEGKFLGYQPMVIGNVQISSDLTQEVNFPLKAITEGVQMQEIVVQRERDLVQKNATNAVRISTAEDVKNLPVRGVVSAVILSPGVVEQGGEIFIRGGRAEETGYYLEGANAKNVITGGVQTVAIPEALEEFQVQAGGYTAQYGGANAGIVKQSLKSGTSEYKLTLQAETDNFAKAGKPYLGGYSYGYSDYVGTISGPIIGDKIKFFVAGENAFTRDNTTQFWKGFQFENLPNRNQTGDTLRSLVVPDGTMPGQLSNRYTVNGTVTFDYNPIIVRFGGAFTRQETRGGNNIFNILDVERIGITDASNMLLNAKLTHIVSPKVLYEVNVNYNDNRSKAYDPYFNDEFLLYRDSLANAQFGYGSAFTNYTTPVLPYDTYGFSWNKYGTPLIGYSKNMQTRWGVTADLTAQMGSMHELKAGGSYERYTYRTFNSGSGGLLTWYRQNPDMARTPSAERDYQVARNGGVNNFGYDVYGNEINTDDIGEGAKHPTYASAYVQDKIEYNDLVVNAGVRFDYFDNADFRFIDDPTTPNVVEGPDNPSVDALTFLYKDTGIEKKKPFSSVSPRLGFSFPVTDRTVFHLQWGKFIQSPALNQLYISRRFWGVVFSGGNAILNPGGMDLDPQRTTAYEVGFTQQISDAAVFDITAYYKDIRGQLQVVRQNTTPTSVAAAYNTLANGDFATTKGVEFSFRLRRTARLTAVLNYTFSDAKGTGSTTTTGGSAVSSLENGTQYPTVVSPLNFNQAHRGAVNIDYRFGVDDGGPILEQLGLNLLFTFNSGHPYTYSKGSAGQQGPGTGALIENDVRNGVPLESVNESTTPWVYSLDLRLDKTVKIGPLNTNFYVYVQNLLNTKNVTDVYRRSGNASDDGYLNDPTLSGAVLQSFGAGAPTYVSMYKAVNLEDSQLLGNMWSSPRQVRFGIRLEY
jgi:outer membrane receptor protein involved in Fe transport